LDGLENFPGSSPLSIKEELKLIKGFYDSIKSGNMIDYNDFIHSSLDNFELYTKEYKEIIINSTNINTYKKPTFNNITKNVNKLFQNSIIKYEEFKNALKAIYSLDCVNLMIDNKIINFMERESELVTNKTNPAQMIQTYENFYLETSIEMFK
jgi:hypothetical protein